MASFLELKRSCFLKCQMWADGNVKWHSQISTRRWYNDRPPSRKQECNMMKLRFRTTLSDFIYTINGLIYFGLVSKHLKINMEIWQKNNWYLWYCLADYSTCWWIEIFNRTEIRQAPRQQRSCDAKFHSDTIIAASKRTASRFHGIWR